MTLQAYIIRWSLVALALALLALFAPHTAVHLREPIPTSAAPK